MAQDLASCTTKKLMPVVTTEQTGLLVQGGGYEREGLHVDYKVRCKRNSDELRNGYTDNGD